MQAIDYMAAESQERQKSAIKWLEFTYEVTVPPFDVTETPILSTFTGEIFLEGINRIYNLLQPLEF